MKKVFCMIVSALLLFAVCGCTTSDVSSSGKEGASANGAEAPEPSEAPTEPTGAPEPSEDPAELTEAPVSEASLLPDWPAEDARDDDWLTYKNVSPEMLRGYTDSLEEKGFTLVENEDGKWAKILYRTDAWVEISDNAESSDYCAVRVSLDTHSGGMVTDLARAAIEAYYRGHENERPEGELAAVLDITPEGLFDGSGMQLFRALFDARPKPKGSDPVFATVPFIAAGSTAEPVTYYDCVCADIDSDGENEAVLIGPGFTSGLFSIIFKAFGIENGELHRIGVSGYTLDFGLSSLAAHDGRVYFVWEKQLITPGDPYNVEYDEPREFELILEGGELLISDPGNLLAAGLMAHFD